MACDLEMIALSKEKKGGGEGDSLVRESRLPLHHNGTPPTCFERLLLLLGAVQLLECGLRCDCVSGS